MTRLNQYAWPTGKLVRLVNKPGIKRALLACRFVKKKSFATESPWTNQMRRYNISV